MKYISAIKLKNFQSHIDSTLAFSGGLNVIVGPSDSGKTAIIRAIKWVLYDEPQGDAVIRTGTEEVYVKIEMSDGSWIKKTRKKKKTVYVLFDIWTEKEEVFQGSRGDVKQRVANILGMRFDADGGKSSFNLQEQLEAPFLLSASGSSKAMAIGQLIGLDVIDDATQGTRTDITTKKQQINRFIKEEDRLDEILMQYSDLESISDELNRIDHLLSEIAQKKKRMDTLSDLLMNKNLLNTQINEVQQTIDKYVHLEKWIDVLKQLEKQYDAYKFRIELLEQKRILEDFIRDNLKIISETQEVHNIEKLLECLQEKNFLFSRLRDFTFLVDKISKEMNSTEKILQKTSEISKIESLESVIREKNYLLEKSKKLLDRHNKIQYDKNVVILDLKRHSELDHVLRLNEQIEDKIKLFEGLKNNAFLLKDYAMRIQKGHLYLSERESDIKEKTQEYENLWSKEERCPTCLRPISAHDMKNIMCGLEG